jgi:hypothetical protein
MLIIVGHAQSALPIARYSPILPPIAARHQAAEQNRQFYAIT